MKSSRSCLFMPLPCPCPCRVVVLSSTCCYLVLSCDCVVVILLVSRLLILFPLSCLSLPPFLSTLSLKGVHFALDKILLNLTHVLFTVSCALEEIAGPRKNPQQGWGGLRPRPRPRPDTAKRHDQNRQDKTRQKQDRNKIKPDHFKHV
jgi:hypothetical protein